MDADVDLADACMDRWQACPKRTGRYNPLPYPRSGGTLKRELCWNYYLRTAGSFYRRWRANTPLPHRASSLKLCNSAAAAT